jgi:uncharacterized protein YndB with AHSA1/START domain
MKSNNLTCNIEQTFNAPVKMIWKAITNNKDMKKWYFDISEFKAEPGFEFHFYAGNEDRVYLHLCTIKEIIEGKKISYSWSFDGYPGNSMVSFELFEDGNKTRLKLTHEGLESFPKNNPDFAIDSFEQGWQFILGTSLKDFIEGTAN